MQKISYTFAILLLLCAFFDGCNAQHKSDRVPLAERFDPVEQSYAFAIPNLPPVPGISGIAARDCGQCHLSIYQEWQASTHATALRDIQFQAELAKPDSPKWVCLNCHIPLQNQRELIVTHLEDSDIFRPVTTKNRHFDAALQREAVTCATCHVRPSSDSTSVIIGPTGSNVTPHPVQQDRDFLRDMCQRCHNPQGEALTPNLICWFETTRELAEAQSEVAERFGETQDCVECHMPAEQRHAADTFVALPKREVNAHKWVGSGIPKWYDGFEDLPARGYAPGLAVEIEELKIAASDSFRATVVLTNATAGHFLPTGDPERFLLALAYFEDRHGERLSVERLKIGQEWQWNPARKVGDNRLKFGESRRWQVRMSWPESAAKWGLLVYNVRLNSDNARHMMETKGVDETYLENGQHLVENIIDYYPFAMVIFKEEIELATQQRRRLSPEELIALSKKERGKPLAKRDY